MECAVCYGEFEEYVTCECRSVTCSDCFTAYSDHCFGQNRVPKCIICPNEYNFDSFMTDNDAVHYGRSLHNYLKQNPDFRNRVNMITREQDIIETIRQKKMSIVERLPAAIALTIQLCMMKEYREAMKVNQDFVKKRSRIVKVCFSGVCNLGNLTQNPNEDWLCDTCAVVFCRQCERPKTEGHTCRQEDLDSIASLAVTTHCPGCRAPVQRISGCAHLKCLVCQTHFNEDTGAIMYAGVQPTDRPRTLVSDLVDYPREVIRAVKDIEDNPPLLPEYNVFVDYLNLENIDDETAVGLLQDYTVFRKAQNATRVHYERLTRIRQLHIDGNLTVETLNVLNE
jgi:LSD1 subclass zinc finger protein